MTQTIDQWLFYIGYICLGVAIIISGSGVSGDRMRANHYSEQQNDSSGKERRSRLKWAGWFLLGTIVFLGAAILLNKLAL